MNITAVEVRAADFPLRNTFRTALGQKKVTHNVLVKVSCGKDIHGWGEASASLAMPEATQSSMSRILRASAAMVKGKPIAEWPRLAEQVRRKFKSHPTAVSALECALLDAYCRSDSLPLHRFFGSRSAPVTTSYTLSALDLPSTEKVLRAKSRQGFQKLKIKVTGDADEDFRRIQVAARFCGKEKMIVDANQAWKPEEGIKFINRLYSGSLPIAVIEQPVRREDIKGLAFVKKRSPYPVAADESVRSPADAAKIIDQDAADILNIKIAKLGLLPAFKIARAARSAGKRLMIGCMMESAAGLATSVFWAIGSGIFEYVDLDSFLLLKPARIISGFAHQGPSLFVRGKFAGSGTDVP